MQEKKEKKTWKGKIHTKKENKEEKIRWRTKSKIIKG